MTTTTNDSAYEFDTLRAKMESRERPVGAKDARPNDTKQIIGRLLRYMTAGGRKPRLIAALILSAASVIGLVLIPTFTGQATDIISTGGQPAQLLRPILLGFGCALVFFVLQLIAARLISNIATNALADLQQDLFNNMQGLSIGFFDSQPIGQLLSRVTNDTEVVSGFYTDVVSNFVQSIFQIVLLILIMFYSDWRLALIVMLIVPALVAISAVIQRISGPAFTRLQEQSGDVSGFQEETISAAKVIISNRRHAWADARNTELSGYVYDTASKAYFVSLIQMPVTIVVNLITMIVVVVLGSLMALQGSIGVGLVITFIGYVSLLTGPLSGIANLMGSVLAAVAGARRVFAIIDTKPTVIDKPGAPDFVFKGGHVEFKDVDFSYVPGKKILRHNTFEAQPGEKIGLCGPTGAGKSTIMNILTRYYDVDSGQVFIDGQDISEVTQRSLREQIGMVLQEPFLFSDTVMNNLKYAREGATDEECIAAAKEASAHEFIMNLPAGYDTMLTERGANLSAGQRQMITIARAMVARPKLLCLDEATSNVDTRTEKLIQEGLRKLMEGRTSFAIAHRLSTIRDSAKILVVNGGELVEQGPHDELMTSEGFYYTLYMSQFKGKAPGGAAAGDAEFVST